MSVLVQHYSPPPLSLESDNEATTSSAGAGPSEIAAAEILLNNEAICATTTQRCRAIHSPALLTTIPCHQKIKIEFRAISYQVQVTKRKDHKTILRDLGGEFHSGEMVALMGPSGAGKTTLLNVLAGYRVGRLSSGEILVNGQPRVMRSFRKLSSYIMQDSALLPQLSVLEAMHVAAALKLGDRVTAHQQHEIIQEVLLALGLMECSNTTTAKLSGGQRKRLSIAQELVSNPPVMFFDEPTSCLDSVSSHQCVSVLKNLARGGRLIVCSIHQPSARILEMFDRLYMLANGQCIYRGAVPGLVPFLASEAGLHCPTTHNPADYVMEMASGEHGDVLTTLVNAVENSAEGHGSSGNSAEQDKDLNVMDSRDFPVSQWIQLRILLQRSVTCALRDRTHLRIRLGAHVVGGLLIGLVYFRTGNDASRVFSNGGYLILSLMFLVFCAMMPTIVTFPSEQAVFEREHLNSWYSLRSFYFAKNIAVIPFQVGYTIIFLTITHFLTEQPAEIWRFLLILLSGVLLSLVAQSIGLLIGAAVRIEKGVVLAAAISIPMMMVSGYFLTFSTIPAPLRWLCYVSYVRYGLEGFMLAIYGGDRGNIPCPEDYCYFRSPDKFLRHMEMGDGSVWVAMAALLLHLTVTRLLVFLVLKWKQRN